MMNKLKNFFSKVKEIIDKVLEFLEPVFKVLRYIKKEFISYPLFIMSSPFKGYDEFKREKRGKLWVAVVFLCILSIINIMEYRFLGYIVAPTKRVEDLDPLYEFALVFVVVIVITISNWAFTTLFDGKGKMKEIFTMLGYSVFPLVCAKFFAMIFSNFIVANEVAIYNLIISLGTFLMGYLAFFGFLSIHEYGVLKSLISLITTGLAILVIAFGFLLAFDLFQKMSGFVYTIYQEITLRYF